METSRRAGLGFLAFATALLKRPMPVRAREGWGGGFFCMMGCISGAASAMSSHSNPAPLASSLSRARMASGDQDAWAFSTTGDPNKSYSCLISARTAARAGPHSPPPALDAFQISFLASFVFSSPTKVRSVLPSPRSNMCHKHTLVEYTLDGRGGSETAQRGDGEVLDSCHHGKMGYAIPSCNSPNLALRPGSPHGAVLTLVVVGEAHFRMQRNPGVFHHVLDPLQRTLQG